MSKTYDCCEHCETYLGCPEAETGHSIPCPDGCEQEEQE